MEGGKFGGDSSHQTRSLVITRDLLAGVKTHTYGYAEERLDKLEKKRDPELEKGPAREEKMELISSDKMKDRWG